jgi:hypothetical protein
MSTPKPKAIRVLLGFRSATDTDVVSRGMAVFTGLSGNLKFPNPPVDLNRLKTSLDRLVFLIAEAADGSKKAIAAKNKERENIIKMLRQLAIYVETTCNEDPEAFTSSGFVAVSTTRTPAAPLTQPAIKKVEPGPNSGELLVRISALPKARSYDLQHAPFINGAPGPWTTLTLTSVKSGVLVKGLTPGTIYAFRVRALGKLGPTDYTDATTKMAT